MNHVYRGFCLFGGQLCSIREITWALYPAGAALLALGIVTPLTFGGKHRILLSVFMLAALIMPFLLLVEQLSSNGLWAWSVGLPIAAVSVAVLLLAVILFRYTRINRWYCAGITVLAALPISLVSNYVVSKQLLTSMDLWQTVLNAVGTVMIGAAIFRIGMIRGGRTTKSGG